MQSKSKRTNKNKKQAPQLQLSQQISLLNSRSSAYANISYPFLIYGYNGSDLYSTTNVGDIRFIAFSAVLGSNEFTNFGTVYSNYRVKSLSLIVNPMVSRTAVANCPLLQVNCDPEANISANPTNSAVILRDTNHLFSAQAVVPKSVTFTFPGVGTSTNIWKSVADLPLGGITFGNNIAPVGSAFFAATTLVFEVCMTLLVEFNNAK